MFIPDPRWEEPSLLIPGKKPTGPVVVDRSNKFGRDLYRSWFIHGDTREVSGTPSLDRTQINTTNSTRRVGGDVYAYADHGGSVDDRFGTADYHPALDSANSSVHRQTLVIRFTPDVTQAHNIVGVMAWLRDYNLGFYIRRDASGHLGIGFSAPNGWHWIKYWTAGWDGGKVNTIGISIDVTPGAKAMNLYFNGMDASSADGTDAGSISLLGGGSIGAERQFGIGNNAYTNYYHYKGTIESVSIFHKFYNQAELDELCRNPYQFLIPA